MFDALVLMLAVFTPFAAQTAVASEGAASSQTVQFQECDGNQCDAGNPGTWTFSRPEWRCSLAEWPPRRH